MQEWEPDGYLKPFDLRPGTWRRLGVVALVLIASLGLSYESRVEYGTVAFWDLPNRINYCGRRYYPSSHDVKMTHESAAATASVPTKWKTVGWTFFLKRIEAAVIENRSADSVCTMSLYIATGDGYFRAYGLSGGP